jgi:hypothetical protein
MGIDVFEVPFIQSPMKAAINNATSTRQNLNSATGLLVLARDTNTGSYWHNYMSLQEENTPKTALASRENEPSTRDGGSDVSVRDPRER